MNLDWSVVWRNAGVFRDGLVLTIGLAAAAMAVGIPGGVALAVLRMSRFTPVARITGVLVDVVRSSPVLLQIYWCFYVLPATFDVRLSAFATGVLALAINVCAYNCEIFRAGVQSIRPGQVNAGLSLAMSRVQVFRHVLLPQAFRRTLPALANVWVTLFKSTSLVSTIAVAELSYAALKLRVETFRVLEILTALGVLYWLLGYPQAKLVDWLHRRTKVNE